MRKQQNRWLSPQAIEEGHLASTLKETAQAGRTKISRFRKDLLLRWVLGCWFQWFTPPWNLKMDGWNTSLIDGLFSWANCWFRGGKLIVWYFVYVHFCFGENLPGKIRFLLELNHRKRSSRTGVLVIGSPVPSVGGLLWWGGSSCLSFFIWGRWLAFGGASN